MAEASWAGVKLLELETGQLIPEDELSSFALRVEFSRMVIEQSFLMYQEAVQPPPQNGSKE